MRPLRRQNGERHLALGVVSDEVAFFLFVVDLFFVSQGNLVVLEKLFLGDFAGVGHNAFDLFFEVFQLLGYVYHCLLLQLIELVESLGPVVVHVEKVPLGDEEGPSEEVFQPARKLGVQDEQVSREHVLGLLHHVSAHVVLPDGEVLPDFLDAEEPDPAHLLLQLLLLHPLVQTDEVHFVVDLVRDSVPGDGQLLFLCALVE